MVQSQVTTKVAGRGEKAWRREIEGINQTSNPRTPGHDHCNPAELECDADVWQPLRDLGEVVRYLENRAYQRFSQSQAA